VPGSAPVHAPSNPASALRGLAKGSRLHSSADFQPKRSDDPQPASVPSAGQQSGHQPEVPAGIERSCRPPARSRCPGHNAVPIGGRLVQVARGAPTFTRSPGPSGRECAPPPRTLRSHRPCGGLRPLSRRPLVEHPRPTLPRGAATTIPAREDAAAGLPRPRPSRPATKNHPGRIGKRYAVSRSAAIVGLPSVVGSPWPRRKHGESSANPHQAPGCCRVGGSSRRSPRASQVELTNQRSWWRPVIVPFPAGAQPSLSRLGAARPAQSSSVPPLTPVSPSRRL